MVEGMPDIAIVCDAVDSGFFLHLIYGLGMTEISICQIQAITAFAITQPRHAAVGAVIEIICFFSIVPVDRGQELCAINSESVSKRGN